ncbi:MAG: tRNA (adenosine(37)-N6)-threonylcarbamoyltransferase complex ATPase subunit type 1 TsaE [Phycisphaerae bacterium]|nr:tRNA (adenosine(37)-N6)-threonylcarbamoyltransferase complex ATPase subunit type 1 TsaE [Phycisphaerae bacterium]
MTTIVRHSRTEDETHRLAGDLARVLKPGDAVLIDGELGAGKTTLIRSIVAALGHDASAVSSPTFVLAHEYRAPGRPTVAHIDAYRMHGTEDAGVLGLESDAPRIILVEWASRLGLATDSLHSSTARVRMEHAGETSRTVHLDVPNTWLARPALARLGGPTWAVCPITSRAVPPDCPTFPFADERARLADLHGWFTGSYRVSRPLRPDDD